MNKKQFLEAIRSRIKGLSESDIEKSLDYYSEMIDDRMEDGMTEEEAVAELGTVDEIVAQILNDIPLPKLVKEKVKPSRTLRAWEVILIVLGFPVWFPILIAVFSVFLSVYIALWSIDFALYAIDFAVLISGIGCLVASILLIVLGNPTQGLLIFGSGLVCIGMSILMFLLFNLITVGFLKLSKLFLLCIKSLFVRKERN